MRNIYIALEEKIRQERQHGALDMAPARDKNTLAERRFTTNHECANPEHPVIVEQAKATPSKDRWNGNFRLSRRKQFEFRNSNDS